MFDYQSRNKNSHIVSRRDRRGNIRTETTRRDDGEMNVAVSTNSSQRTRLFLNFDEDSVALTGSQARTLYRALQKHFAVVGKPL